jgi:hypothetical protein
MYGEGSVVTRGCGTDASVGIEVEARGALHPDEIREILGKCGIGRLGTRPAAIEATRRRHHLLRARVDAVLIGKDFDQRSLNDT